MGRPEHLSCVNTAQGISRINEMQRAYDDDPEAYEREELRREEQYRLEQEQEAEAMREQEQGQKENQ